ncbi:MAG: tRNA preQ1(34) S-adenosylmethionine ribosyltransferase-isomerase QueA [Proteobacteria bacterium]|nr:tRNA preQ1(34) S-adenosylmethionine ribosyltransferase-isomerase QueA [Pseudomonadota bacterium]
MDLNQKSTYEFALPESQIATHPREPRDAAKLLVVKGQKREHRIFRDIVDILKPGDCLVVNDVTVQKARFFAKRATGGVIEVLITDDITAPRRTFECLYRANHLAAGEILTAVNDDSVQVTLKRNAEDRSALCEITFLGEEPVVEILDRIGQLPLPPYIVKQRKNQGHALYEDADTVQYQTVYANAGSAVAAPTAGLHFTDALIEKIRAKGIRFERLTLDVGTGTFRPVQTENLNDHVMHTERYRVSQKLAEAIEETKRNNGRVIAVGTTVVRSLEDQFDKFGKIVEGTYDTNIFLKPGRKFGMVDAIITNFHLPGSTLIVLVSAFAGYENTMAAYKEAIEQGYLFYSYGDAMFLEPETL